MIALAHNPDYVVMLLIAAGVGAIGGLGAELLLKRSDNTGTLLLPSYSKGTHVFELGFPASLILGAIAAVAILYFFPPVTDTVTPAANGSAPTTTHEYDLVKLVALSLIVGSAGPAFLGTAQSRLMSALNAQKVGAAVETGKNQINQVAESAKAAMVGAVQTAVSEQLPGTSVDQLKAIVESASASLETTLQPQLQVARDQVDAIGQTPKAGNAAGQDEA